MRKPFSSVSFQEKLENPFEVDIIIHDVPVEIAQEIAIRLEEENREKRQNVRRG